MEVKGGNEVRFRKGRWLDFNLKEVMLGKAAKKSPLSGLLLLGVLRALVVKAY